MNLVQEIRPHTVIIRIAPGVEAQVLLYNGEGYRPASNGDELRSAVNPLVANLPAGDYACPVEVSVRAQF
jgi:hypothetical protein